MKLVTFFRKLSYLMLFVCFTNAIAQTNVWSGAVNNNWNNGGNWSLGSAPTAANDVVINSNATIQVNANATINSLTVNSSAVVSLTATGGSRTITIDNTGSSITSGSSLTLNGSTTTRTLTIAYTGTSRTMSIAGTLNVTGVGGGAIYLAANSSTSVTGTLIKSSGTITSTASNLTIASGGTYQHNMNGGAIATATWNANSTCNVVGVTGTLPTGLGQTFGHFTWNCTGQTATVSNLVGGGLVNVAGNFTVSSTNGEILNFNNSGTNSTISIGGNFSIANGDVDLASAVGSTTINVAGNISVAGASTLDSSTTNATTVNGTFVINGTGVQTINLATPANCKYYNITINSGSTLQLLSNVGLSKNNNAPFRGTLTVSSGTVLDCGTFLVDGYLSTTLTSGVNAVFNLNSGGKIITSNATGVQGSVVTANVTATFNSGASYEFKGSNTGVFTLTTANTITGVLTFNRSAGVTIDQNFTASTLALTSGIVTTGSNAITIASGGTFSGASSTSFVSGTLRRVYPSATSLVFPIGKGGNYRPVTLQYTSLTGTSTTTIEQFETALTGTLPSSTNLNNTRYWDVSQTGGTGVAYKIQLDATGDTPSGTIVMLKKESGTITSNAVTTPNYTNTTSFTGMTGTVSFTLGSNCTQTSVAGSNTTTCDGSSVVLAANAPTYGSGVWSVTGPSSSTAQFSSTTNPSAAFTPAGGNGTYTLTWTITNGNCSNASNLTVTVGASTTWNGSGWSAGSPTSTSAVIFTGNYTISSDLSVCTITVTNSAVVSVDSGIDVTLNGALTVSSGSFTLNNTANLIQTTNASNSGNIIVKRNSSAIMRLDYTLWCSPVSGSQTLLNFSPNTLVDRFYEYNPSTDEYNSVVPSTTTFGLAKGYLIRVRNAFPTTPTVWPGTFTGVPNNGNITYAMASGFNAVGNPYPSRLNVADFIDGNTATTGTLYFWRKSNNAANTSYATVTKIAYTANSAAGGDTGTGFFNVGDEANWVINIGQGFLVESTSATTLNYNNSMRRSSNSNQFFRQDQNQTLVANPSVYWLNMTNTTGTFSQAAVGYTEDATNGVDRGIDGKNINQDFHLSSLIGAEAYSIQGRSSFEASDVVPLSYKVLTAGSYTIAIDHSTGLFSDGQRVFIKDKTNDSLYDLNAAPFTFTTEVGTFANRFEIVYQNPRETNVQTAQCGQNLTALNQNVYANLVSGAQGYRFKVTNTATNEVQTIDRVLRVFNLSQLGSFAYDKTYTVEVAVKYNNVWQPFGNACTVTTPIAYTKVQTTQCGGQLNTVNDVIYANMVNYAMGYRFRITNTTTNQSVEIDRPIRDVRLSNIGASEPNTIYTFEVAVRNTDGTYLPYGEACSIYSPINDTGRLTLEANKDQYEVIAYPNPYSDSFNLEVTTTSESQIEIKVYDMMGRLVDSKTTSVSEVTSLPLGNSYPSGVYNVIITQGENTTNQRIVRR